MKDDLISRKEAIDAVCMEWCGVKYQDCRNPFNDEEDGYLCDGCETVLQTLPNLPTVQSEVIYCGDCKYKDDGIDEDGIPFLKCLNGRSYGGTRINDYCSWAERRTDG